jgi:hypothetical protein
VVERDWVDSLYRAYLTGLFIVIGVLVAADFGGDQPLSPHGVDQVMKHGPAILGAAVALAVAIGVRAGGRGGPLALEAPDVQHVLLAPIDRALALRPPAIRQLRFAAFAGGGVGAVLGLTASHRLPHHAIEWIISGAAFGALTAVAAIGAGLLASGRRIGRRMAAVVALVVIVWAAIDVWRGSVTSPIGALAHLAFVPEQITWYGVVGVVLALALGAVGLLSVGGTSLEAALRRASLNAQLRFAVTLQDLRTVVLLRRQLAQERPRRRPWVRIKGRWTPIAWARDWQGISRWPLVRILRIVVLSVVAGLALRAVWSGTTPLIVVAGLAMYVAALDVVEPLAQEVDHPDIGGSVPIETGLFQVRHLAAPTAAGFILGAIGLGAAVAIGPVERTLSVGAVVAIPVVLSAVAGATVSTLMRPAATFGSSGLFPPEAMGAVLVGRTAGPPAIAIIGTTPVIAARVSFHRGGSPISGAVAITIFVMVLVGFVVAWVRYREPARVWWDDLLEQAGMKK